MLLPLKSRVGEKMPQKSLMRSQSSVPSSILLQLPEEPAFFLETVLIFYLSTIHTTAAITQPFNCNNFSFQCFFFFFLIFHFLAKNLLAEYISFTCPGNLDYYTHIYELKNCNITSSLAHILCQYSYQSYVSQCNAMRKCRDVLLRALSNSKK